ncbi:MAG: glutaredoxin [bacterium]|nr:glutaredoxin [bacterium]
MFGSVGFVLAQVNTGLTVIDDEAKAAAEPGEVAEEINSEVVNETGDVRGEQAVADDIQEDNAPAKVMVEVFKRDDCVHCLELMPFLEELKKTRGDFEIVYYDIINPEHFELFSELTEAEKISKVTPITVVGNQVIVGYASAETTGQRIEQIITAAQGKETMGAREIIMAGGSGNVESVADGVCDDLTGCVAPGSEYIFNLPIIGTPINVGSFSLPVLSIVLGFIDGFNPCAMWVLVTFILILMQLGDRRKMWRFVGLFIIAEAVMYYLILNVWFTAWDFVGLDRIVTPLIGLLAIGSGIYFLYEWYTSDGTCEITSFEQKKKISDRIKHLAAQPLTLITAAGIIGVALSVNIIEFACSIGVPQAFTKIIEINNLSWFSTQAMMALYILFYMVDDFIVFGIALYSFKRIGLTTKYAHWSNLIGGILMVILGLILLFKREWLLFG